VSRGLRGIMIQGMTKVLMNGTHRALRVMASNVTSLCTIGHHVDDAGFWELVN